jgi:phosphoglycolate phosphatase
VLEEYGCPPHAEDAIGRMVGDGAATLVARAFKAAGCAQPVDALRRFLAVYNSHLLDHTRPYPGIPEVLAELAPRVTLAVLTNKPLGPTRTILAGLGLADVFSDRVVGGDGPFPRKPDPSGLRHLVSTAPATDVAATLLVGDSEVDWRTARTASAGCCLVRYGFGFPGVPLAELSDSDFVIDHPAQLLTLL